MTINQPEPADFIPYPSERVVGTIADAKNARAAIEALLSEGFEDSDIDILRGEDDLHRLDPTGSEHGFLARFQRTLIRALGPAEEFKHLGRHVDDLRAGRFVIMVLARQRERRRRAADILNSHGAEFVGFYGKWAWQSLDAIELRYGSCASSRLAGSRRTRNVPRFAGDCVPPGGSIGAGIRRHGIRQGLQNGYPNQRLGSVQRGPAQRDA